MNAMDLKITRIGNSRGVRLPAATLRRFRLGETVVMEERSDGILLRPPGPVVAKLSWQETARAMGASGEEWQAWDRATADGLETAPWDDATVSRGAERTVRYRTRASRKEEP
jgi:antitoxin component of MazEF toxin-antitoxin module